MPTIFIYIGPLTPKSSYLKIYTFLDCCLFFCALERHHGTSHLRLEKREREGGRETTKTLSAAIVPPPPPPFLPPPFLPPLFLPPPFLPPPLLPPLFLPPPLLPLFQFIFLTFSYQLFSMLLVQFVHLPQSLSGGGGSHI